MSSNTISPRPITTTGNHKTEQQTSTTTTDHIPIPSARQKILQPSPYNNNHHHKKTLSSPPPQITSTTTTTNINNSTTSHHHSQPISINNSFKNNSRKNKSNNNTSTNNNNGSFKKGGGNADQVLSREIDQHEELNNHSNIDHNTRSRAKSFQNNSQFTPKQALLKSSNKQLLNVSSKSIPNSLNDDKEMTFEVSKSNLINNGMTLPSNNNSSSPTKYVKTMTPSPQQRKKQQKHLVEDHYSSSAPSKFSLKFDDDNMEEENGVLDEVLDDLIIRFVLNCPTLEVEEMEGIDSREFETLFFHLEEAFWFYYDFHRPKHKSLPKYKFSMFCEKVFARCPTLLDSLTQDDPSQVDVDSLVQRFLYYKTSVPVYGCIILNENLDKVLLVQGYNTKSWSFPKGKINQNERETTCAAREVYEECGYDLGDKVTEQDFIELEQNYENSVPDYKDKYKHSNPYTKLFIVGGIPEATNFVTRTRKEILKIKWFSIDYLFETCYPRSKEKQGLRTWLVKPFLNSLMDWIKKKKQPTTTPKTPEKKSEKKPERKSEKKPEKKPEKPVNRNNRSMTAPALPHLSVSTITQNNMQTAGSPLLSFVFDTEEILEKK